MPDHNRYSELLLRESFLSSPVSPPLPGPPCSPLKLETLPDATWAGLSLSLLPPGPLWAVSWVREVGWSTWRNGRLTQSYVSSVLRVQHPSGVLPAVQSAVMLAAGHDLPATIEWVQEGHASLQHPSSPACAGRCHQSSVECAVRLVTDHDLPATM